MRCLEGFLRRLTACAPTIHTRLLLGVSATIMERADVAVEHVHMLDHTVLPGDYPSHGNDCRAWEAGCRFGYANPDYRA